MWNCEPSKEHCVVPAHVCESWDLQCRQCRQCRHFTRWHSKLSFLDPVSRGTVAPWHRGWWGDWATKCQWVSAPALTRTSCGCWVLTPASVSCHSVSIKHRDQTQFSSVWALAHSSTHSNMKFLVRTIHINQKQWLLLISGGCCLLCSNNQAYTSFLVFNHTSI